MAKILVRAFSEVATADIARFGEQKKGLGDVQKFLTRFGYLQIGNFKSGELDTLTSDALRKYQEHNGLDTTGEFDTTTRNQMTTHRCAHPDLQDGVAFVTRCAWNLRNLTFAFNNGTNDVADQAEFQAVRNAFQTWAATVPITFTEVGGDANPDIVIDWRDANDPDLSMVGGTLAHADFPPGCGVVTNNLPKPIHFDDSEHMWSVGAVANAFDIETVALHEIGHILGLQHTTVAGAVMFPTVSANSTLRTLQLDDLAGIRSLYGPFAQGDDMQPGEILNPDQSITSANGRYRFIYQGDGNLVLYDGGTPLWASNTDGRPAGVCIMQGDGNLVIYVRGGQPIWASNTDGNTGSRLVVQDDGNVVIYRPDGTPVWATNTVQP